MPEYEYQAVNPMGQPVHGSLIAVDEPAARRELEARGLSVADLLWCPVVDETGTLGDAELAKLTHAVGSAATSRVPLDVTLAIPADDADDPRLASVARRISQRLVQGATVDQATNAIPAASSTATAVTAASQRELGAAGAARDAASSVRPISSS